MSIRARSSLNYNGPCQIFAPQPQIIATQAVGGGENSLITRVRLPVPDSRTRVKLTVMFVPASGVANPDMTADGDTIWVAAYDEDSTGGGGGRTVPITDVEGTSALPTSFPVSSGLLGYSREFVTAADWIEAVIHLESTLVAGAWVLQTRIQPDAVSFSWDEWDQIRRAFIPEVSVRGTL